MSGQKFVQMPRMNIYTYPQKVVHPVCAGMQLTTGDLHANAMKLIHFLSLHGVLQPTLFQYKKMKDSYYTTKLTKKQLSDFLAALDKITINPESAAALIRLIGDELADRGINDYFILKIIQKLKRSGVNLEILLSNHGVEFVKAYEAGGRFESRMLGPLAASMENMQTLIDEGLVSRAEIDELITDCYKPSLKLISCSLSEDENEITLYSHAAMGIDTIEHLANKFGVEFKDDTPKELAQTIEAINQIFAEHVNANTVHTLCDEYWMNEGANQRHIDPKVAPVPFVLWNRQYDCINRPHAHKGYRINYVHGHDTGEPTHDHIFNLDNSLGIDAVQSSGTYHVLLSDDHALAPRPMPVAAPS